MSEIPECQYVIRGVQLATGCVWILLYILSWFAVLFERVGGHMSAGELFVQSGSMIEIIERVCLYH